MTKNMPTTEAVELACMRLFKFMQQLHKIFVRKRFRERKKKVLKNVFKFVQSVVGEVLVTQNRVVLLNIYQMDFFHNNNNNSHYC
jgi:hypothetical protein